MCNRYLIKAKLENLADRYQARLFEELDVEQEVLPLSLAPGVIDQEGEGRVIAAMQFAFCPPGCPTPSDPKRTLNNARIESVRKWPWKEAFAESRCVVPIQAFREPCYWGPTAGAEVNFHRPDQDLLHAAGIYRQWRSPDGAASLLTMSLLMRPACGYVMEHGHHRQPIFLRESGLGEWLAPRTLSAEQGVQMLRALQDEPELIYTEARQMAPSWTKRQAARLRQRDAQLSELQTLPPVGF